MLPSPISEETIEALRENAKETAKQFGISYGLNAAWSLYEKEREAAEKSDPVNFKLSYREFDSVARTDLLTGYVDVREGEGPGAMGSWKKVYCVERSDYGIEFYASRQAYQRHRKPKTTIRPAGYKVLKNDVGKPFKKLLKPVARGLDVNPDTLKGLVDFPHDSWALFHPLRTKYVFRMCQKSRFARKKKEPPVSPDEQLIDRKEWIYFLNTCVQKSNPRNKDTVLGRAFDETCKKMSGKVEALEDWEDDGTEDEMLLEMLVTSCLTPAVQEGILAEVKDHLSIPFAPMFSFASIIASRVLIPLWYKTVGLIKRAIQTVLNAVWSKIQKEAQALLDKIQPVLTKGLAPIVKVHNKVLETIKKATNQTIGRLLSKLVTPLIEPILRVYAKPLTDGFTYVREIYWTSVASDKMPEKESERKDYLDAIPRKRMTMKAIHCYSIEMSKSLKSPKKLLDDIVKTLGCHSDDEDDDEEEDEYDVCAEAEESLLKGLDATVYTLHLRLEKGEQMNDALAEKILTEEFDRDVPKLKRDIVKKGTQQFVLKYFKKAVLKNDEVSKAIKTVDDLIPSEMHDILSLEAIFEKFIDIVVGEPIILMVESSKTL